MPNNLRSERVISSLRALLRERKVSQADIAAELKISQQAVSRRLAGGVLFDIDQLDAIAKRLDVPLSAIVGDDNETALEAVAS